MDLDVFALMQGVKQPVVHLGLSSARMLGLIAILPVFKRTELGRAILGVIALAMSLPVLGGHRAEMEALPLDSLWFVGGLMVKEFGVGALIGIFFAIPIWAVQAGGEIIDTQRSIAGQGGAHDPSTGDQASVTSSLLGLAAITVFVTEGGLALTISTIWGSYAAWPLTDFLPTAPAATAVARIGGTIGEVLLAGLLLAAPFVVIFLLSDVAGMAIGRLAGRIDVSGLLPLMKNVLFAAVALVYVQLLVQHMRGDLAEAWKVPRLLETLTGR